ncbi:MAG TPA: hypothetical protein VHT34_00615, partial [Clostridia bacterium]|nr:hypothetical protein [Clostridia bacterium]
MKKKLMVLILAGVFLMTQCITAIAVQSTNTEGTSDKTPSISTTTSSAISSESGFATDRYIVKYKDNNEDKSEKGREKLKKKLDNKLKKAKKMRSKKNFENITLTAKEKPDDFITQMMKDNSDIEYIQPDYEMSLSSNDTYFTSQWGISNGQSVDAKVVPAWDISQGEGVIVAVIDTGVDINHEDISANVWRNVNEIAGNGID